MPPRRRSSSAPPVQSDAGPDTSSSGAPASVATSLLHALQAWPVRIVVGGRGYVIPPTNAATWIAALMSEDLTGSFLNLLDDEDNERVWDAIIDGEVDLEILSDTILNTVTLVSGRSWWFTMKLLYAAQNSWDAIGGYLALKGIRADVLPLQGYLDAVLAAVLRHVEPKNQTPFLARLRLPPAGQKIELDEKKEADAFLAYMGGR